MLKARFRAPRPPDIPARMLVLNFVDEEKPSQLMLHDPDSNGAAATPKALAYDPTPADMIADVDVTSSRAEVGAEPTEKNSWVMSRLDRLDARLQSIECRLGRIETRLDGIERSANRSDAVAADVQAIGSHVDSLQSQVNRVEGIKPFPRIGQSNDIESTKCTQTEVIDNDDKGSGDFRVTDHPSPTIGFSLCSSCRDRDHEYSLARAANQSFTPRYELTNKELDCPLCAMLLNIASAYVSDTYRSDAEIDEVVLFAKNASLGNGFNYSSDPEGWLYGSGYLDVFLDEEHLNQGPQYSIFGHSKRLPAPSSNPTTGSDGFLRNIPLWITECTQNHPECNVPGTTYLPKRVLDLAPLKEGKDLVLLEPKSQVGEYICLSHCWGDTQPVRTTSSNIGSFTNGIPLAKLPRTFCDAITVANYLGIQYVWIDSLCIIQDDRGDWETQAAQMADIYGRAYLTIAGTGSVNANAGLFNVNHPSEIECTPTQPIPGFPSLFYRETITHTQMRISCLDAKIDVRDVNIEDEAAAGSTAAMIHPVLYPLLDRSWTFQEHLLSPRIIQFTQKEIVWECSRETWCCCTKGSHLWRGRKHFAAALLSPNRPLPDHSPNYLGSPALYEVWRDLVVRYTSKKLAFDKDRLAALSGVARRAQPVLGSTYLAGLWSGDLLMGLCWFVANRFTNCDPLDLWASLGYHSEDGDDHDPSLSARRPIEYRAPSWSWASVEGGIAWVGSAPQPGNFIIHDYKCVLSNEDPTGCVESGYLDIECKVVKCQYVGFYNGIHHRVGHGSLWEMFDADVPYQMPPYDSTLSLGQTVYCVAIGDSSQVYRLEGTPILILRKKQHEPRLYERVGLSRNIGGYPSGPNPDPKLWATLFETASWRRLLIV